MKAKVKKMVLPDAPKPTKPMRVLPPWEQHMYESMANSPDAGHFKQKEPYKKWTQEELDIIEKMWCEGRIAVDIAPKVGGNIRATQNKITYMISKGLLPKRRNTISEEEYKEIKEEMKTMTVPDICRKHNIAQGKLKRLKKNAP